MDSLTTIIDHWRSLAMGAGALGTLRLAWAAIGSAGIAIWERNQLRRQVKVLEEYVTILEARIGVEDSETGSSATSSAAPATTPISTPPTPRS